MVLILRTEMSLLLLLFLPWVVSAVFQIENLDCLNDYVNEMFCFWEIIHFSGRCADQFRLTFTDEESKVDDCIPENMRGANGFIYPNKCICYIPVDFFVVSTFYNIEVKANGEVLQIKDIRPYQKVKPRSPTNLTLEHDNQENVKVHWDTGYLKSNPLHNHLIFQIQLTNKQDPNELKNFDLKQGELSYEICKSKLKRGYDYRIKVRSKPGTNFLTGTWSDWAPGAEWHNDYCLTDTEIMMVAIPISGVLAILFILLCYFLVIICRKKWQDIPDPSKSHLAQSKLFMPDIGYYSQEPVSEPALNNNILSLISNKPSPNITLVNWFNKLIFGEPEDYSFNGDRNIFEREDPINSLLIPEFTEVEYMVDICPLKDDPSNPSKDKKEVDALEDLGDLPLEFDNSINKMFLDILNENPVEHEAQVTNDIVRHVADKENAFQNEKDFSLFKEICAKQVPYVSQIATNSVCSYYNCKQDSSLVTDLSKCCCNNHDQSFPLESLPYRPAGGFVKNNLDDGFDDDDDDVCNKLDYSLLAKTAVMLQNKNIILNSLTDEENCLSMILEKSHKTCPSGKFNHMANLFLSFSHNRPDELCFQQNVINNSVKLTVCNPTETTFKEAQNDAAETHAPTMIEICGYQSFVDAVHQEETLTHCTLGNTKIPITEYKSFDSALQEAKYEPDLENGNRICDSPILVFGDSCNGDTEVKRMYSYALQAPVNDGSIRNKNLVEVLGCDCSDSRNSHFNESCLDNYCKHVTVSMKQQSMSPVSSDHSHSEGTAANVHQVEHENNGGSIYALTFDISNHSRNFKKAMDLKSSVGKNDDNIVNTFSFKLDHFKSNTENGFASVQNHHFLDYPSERQTLEFENISYLPSV
ncbi:uncharacterized protein LOC121399051 [Xenopus laevis]|uniref:Uncharacterized protein LOC121399051 n=2 Tax=Xenopus laevis TaxID=8355 RepID=A0A1L8EQA7_XENLA|nr:uncharacterized protein LOC121399051 [Xenopus laevis]OCT61536.1 hypothetical protein XELAEV_18047562mg [Xenopus laevis]